MSAPVEDARSRAEEQVAVDPGATMRGILAVVLALVFPGLGHFYLGRRARAALFVVLVLFAVFVGTRLDGNLYTPSPGHPLSYLATLGSMGMGIPYFLLLYTWHYLGDVTAAGFDYGTAFLLSAGLMNLLLALDAWDIATGRKE